MVDEYQKKLLEKARENFNISSLPSVAREDGNDILIRLEENLDECRNLLKSDHMLWEYKVCIYQRLDTFENEIWDLRQSLRDEEDESSNDDDFDDSSANSLNAIVLLIPMSLILCLLFRCMK
jgi:hypothetical protein